MNGRSGPEALLERSKLNPLAEVVQERFRGALSPVCMVRPVLIYVAQCLQMGGKRGRICYGADLARTLGGRERQRAGTMNRFMAV